MDYDKANGTSTFSCEYDKLPRGDVKYIIDWTVDDVNVKSETTTGDGSHLEEDLYGVGGYGVKVSMKIIQFIDFVAVYLIDMVKY